MLIEIKNLTPSEEDVRVKMYKEFLDRCIKKELRDNKITEKNIKVIAEKLELMFEKNLGFPVKIGIYFKCKKWRFFSFFKSNNKENTFCDEFEI